MKIDKRIYKVKVSGKIYPFVVFASDCRKTKGRQKIFVRRTQNF